MNTKTDILIIGGGPAGLTAALYLGRARRRVVVVDERSPRHGVSEGVHNFLTREGISPANLRREAWKDLAQFPSVQSAKAQVQGLEYRDGHWLAISSSGQRWSASTVLLAPGVVDEHPQIQGYEARWGTSIHHCPYCHGWEMQDQPLAVLGSGEAAGKFGLLLKGWSDDVVVVTNGRPVDEDSRADLRWKGISVYTNKIAALKGPGPALEAIVFKDGSRLKRTGIFVAGVQHQVQLVEDLGVNRCDDGFVKVDAEQRTSLPMLWAAGDCTSPKQQVIEAAAQGGRAAVSINTTLALGG